MSAARWALLVALGLIAAIALLTEMVIERVLATQVPELLARVTERPVSLGAVDVSLLDLAAAAAELRIGPAEETALLAEEVRVEVDAAALLSGEIRFTVAAASYLSVDIAAWREPTERSGPGLFTRQVLNRWLPASAALDTLAIFDGDRLLSLTEELDWARQPDQGQTLAWRQAGLSGELALRLHTTPLAELLEAQRGELRLEAVRLSAPDEALSVALNIEPATDGIAQTFIVDTPAVAGEWRFVSSELLVQPLQSEVNLSLLDLDILADTFSELLAQPGNTLPGEYMQMPLPVLGWPQHAAKVRIAELVFDDQSYTTLAAAVEMTPATEQKPPRIMLSDLSAESDAAAVTGEIELATGASWQIAVDLQVAGREDGTLAGVLGDDAWRWQRGSIDFVSSGRTLLELMSRAQGKVDAHGEYYADTPLPLRLSAQFDSERGLLGADDLSITVGRSSISGAVWTDASGAELHARLESPFLNLDRLRGAPRPGPKEVDFTLPNLDLFPSALPLDVEFAGQNVRLGGRTYARVSVDLGHRPEGADFTLRLGRQERGLAVTANLERGAVAQTLAVDAKVQDLSLAELGIDTQLHLHSARLRLGGAGAKWSEIFSGMSGDLSVTARAAGFDGELSARANLEAASRHLTITGLAFDDLELRAADTAARGWLHLNLAERGYTGALATAELNIDALQRHFRQGTNQETNQEAASNQSGIINQIRNLPNGELEISAAEVTLANRQLGELTGVVRVAPGDVRIKDLAVAADFGRYTGTARLHADGGQARLSVAGSVTELRPSQLSDIALLRLIEEPLQGKAGVQAEGVNWGDLAKGAQLALELSGPRKPATSPFDINVVLRRDNGDGFQAELLSMRWRNSDVRGMLNYVDRDLPELQANLVSDRIDLTVFTDRDAQDAAAQDEPRRGIVRSVAEMTQGALGLVTETVRGSLAASESEKPRSDRFFSAEPWQNDVLARVRLDLALAAGEVRGPRWVATDVQTEVDLQDGRLTIHAASPDTNGGTVNIGFNYDASVKPPQADINTTLVGVRPRPAADVAPLSIYTALRGWGASEAELVASMNGPVYLEAGRGLTDFGSLGAGILTGDLVQAVFARLLPSAETAPRLSCVVGYGQFDAGITRAPVALVIATAKMNVVVRVQLDFVEEQLSAQFGSRTRTGTGISVGNVFSNTVRLQGALTKPNIVPQTSSLLWRYGAAVATGGLTLLGESMYKRLMADPAPCDTMKRLLRKEVCVPGAAVADSDLVCPG